MRDILLAVVDLLLADAGVSAKVGARVYRGTLPKKYEYPSIVVQRIDKIPDVDTSSSEYATARLQCTTVTKTTEAGGVETLGDYEAEEISDLIGRALHDVEARLVAGVYIVQIEDAGTMPDNSDAFTHGEWRDNHDFKILYLNQR
jgi:hypothetical protein